MKQFLFILTMCCLVMISCQTDTNELTNDSYSNDVEQITPDSQSESSARDLDDSERAEFEHRLQWLSFVVVETLMADRAARNEFMNILGDQNTIALDELLRRDSSTTPLVFESRFRDILYCYFADCGHGDGNQINPGRPVSGNIPPPGFGDDPFLKAMNLYIDDLLDNHCIELYIPGMLNFPDSNDYTVTSTAHPLNTDDFNNGIRRYSTAIIIIGEDGPITIITENVDVDDAYVNSFGRVIVARPVKAMIPDNSCAYSEYPDFTDFLD